MPGTTSRIGLGGAQLGGPVRLDGQPDGWSDVTEAGARAIVRKAVGAGITFFDTADMYGWGRSEEILGEVLAETKEGRAATIATKVGYWHDGEERRVLVDSSPAIVAACEHSLRRLRRETIDLYQCHLRETTRPAEFLEAFRRLKAQGKIRAFGISSFLLDTVRRFNCDGELAAVQANYSLLERSPEASLLPYCADHAIAFVARGLLARGLLSGKYSADSRFDPDDRRSLWHTDPYRERFLLDVRLAGRLEALAATLGMTLLEMSIRFVLSNEGVTTALVGAKSSVQLDQIVLAARKPLSPGEAAALRAALG